MSIELIDIHKHYESVKANNGVSLFVSPGTIHGILGENGAGKSTLMKILSGYCRKTSGEIIVNGASVSCKTPADSANLGIGMLYQDPMDFPQLSVLENFMIGQTQGLAGRNLFFKKQLTSLSQKFNFHLNPSELVKNLTIGERQQLEILRLLSLGVQVLILDEPTTGISNNQKEMLFQALKKLSSEGKIILLVSHKLEDIEALCDKVTVLRQGIVAGDMDKPFDTETLLKMMFGSPPASPPWPGMNPGKPVLFMDGVSASGGRSGLKNCTVTIKEGEVIGLAGLEGSGQGIFLRAASGLHAFSDGQINLRLENMNGKNYHIFKHKGVAFLPASRLEEGLIANLNIAEHYTLGGDQKGLLINQDNALQKAKKKIDKFQIKGNPETPVDSLSGGNQQRLLLSFLPPDPVLLLLENPTRGLDVESVQWVWTHLLQYRTSGASIVFSSSELDEIMTVADRVLVFFNGAIIKDAKTDEISIHEIGKAIAGKI